MENLLNYFIVDRLSDKSYDPFLMNENFLFAYSNCANDKGVFQINIQRLIKGLVKRKYRLVYKNLVII